MPRATAPTTLRLLNGTRPGHDSGDRKVKPSPGFRRIPPMPPAWLSDEAAAEWERVLPELARLDLLKEADGAALAAYCEAWATFVAATKVVQAEGLTIEAKQGTLAHPAVAIARNAGREVRTWAGHFGLTPAAEAGLGVRGGEDNAADDHPLA